MAKQSDGPGILKQAAIQIGAGGSAGFVEVCIMHPMDLVKTRFQLQVKPTAQDPTYYTGIVDCMKKMYVSEGLGAYWKGIVPPIIVETPKRAVKFFTFEQYKQFFLFGASSPTPLSLFSCMKTKKVDQTPENFTKYYACVLLSGFSNRFWILSAYRIDDFGPWKTTFSCAGFFAGVTEGVLVNPFEVIKVQLQSNRKKMKESPSTFVVTKEIIRTKGFGLNGLYKGLSATVLRNAVFNSVYFGFYHSVKGYLPVNKDPWLEFFTKVGIGFTSGTMASCLNIPFDVAKSRIQGPQPNPDSVKYRGTFRTIAIVYREEGFRALYKGLLPKVVRLGPGGAIMLVVYDYMHNYLTQRFAN